MAKNLLLADNGRSGAPWRMAVQSICQPSRRHCSDTRLCLPANVRSGADRLRSRASDRHASGSIESTRRERFSVNLPLARWRSQPHYCLNSEVDQHSPGVHGLYRGSIVPGDSLTHPHPHPSYKPTIELLLSSDTRRRCLHLGFVGPLASDSLTRCTRQLVSVSSYRWRNADDRYVIG